MIYRFCSKAEVYIILLLRGLKLSNFRKLDIDTLYAQSFVLNDPVHSLIHSMHTAANQSHQSIVLLVTGEEFKSNDSGS